MAKKGLLFKWSANLSEQRNKERERERKESSFLRFFALSLCSAFLFFFVHGEPILLLIGLALDFVYPIKFTLKASLSSDESLFFLDISAIFAIFFSNMESLIIAFFKFFQEICI